MGLIGVVAALSGLLIALSRGGVEGAAGGAVAGVLAFAVLIAAPGVVRRAAAALARIFSGR